MYQNNQLELLINAYEGSIPHDITLIIAKIQSIYKSYNADYSRYTQNYISTRYEAEIQQVIDTDDYNTFLRYYDNKGIFTMFLPQLKLENKIPYREAVFAYLIEHKNVLAELREEYFPCITV